MVAAERAGVDRKALQHRLASLTAIDGVLPTRQLEGDLVFDVRRNLGVGLLGAADEVLGEGLFTRGFRQPTGSDAFAQLATTEGLKEQVEAFMEAGLGFMSVTPAYSKLPLEERGEIGANTAVTQVFVEDERLLLETERLHVRVHSGVSQQERQALFDKFRLIPLRELAFAPGLFQVVAPERSAREVSLELMSQSIVEFASPDFIEFIGQRYTPADPLYPQQWHLRNRRIQGADIKAEAAWDHSTGKGIRIAVIDSGFDRHPDLVFGKGSCRFRPRPGFADADFVAGTANMPVSNHGTACAGMAVARSGNGSGGCGVAFEAELMAISCMDVHGITTQAVLSRAIDHAVNPSREDPTLRPEDGVDVITCSLGPKRSATWPADPVLTLSISAATSSGRQGRGTPVFWAVTNGPYPIGGDGIASHPSVLAVGRSTDTDSDDACGYGPELAFLAPGVQVYVPAAGGGYGAISGTSLATPCAAGVAGLVLAANPALSASDVSDILRDTCDKVGDLPYSDKGQPRNDQFGHGRVNAELAIRKARSHISGPNRFPGV